MPYFDHNATTPLSPSARDAWLRANAEVWQNPASPYRDAARVRLRLDAVRRNLAELIEGRPDRLVFTSGATEAANAIFGYLARSLPADSRVAVNPTEHPCVLESAGSHFPGRIDWLPLDANGVVTAPVIERILACRDGSRLGAVVAMAANNETGVLQPWREIAAICAAAGIPYVCDATQWLGKLPAAGLGRVGWMFGSGHKFGGPKGAGFLHLPEQAGGFRGQLGGAQQNGHRGGTEDLAGAAAMVAALAEVERQHVMFETDRLGTRNRFEQSVLSGIRGIRIVGAGADRLWNTVTLVMPHDENVRWVARLDAEGFQVSTGSACSTGKEGSSHVLAALGLPPAEARRAIRISASWATGAREWQDLAGVLPRVGAQLRASSPANVVQA